MKKVLQVAGLALVVGFTSFVGIIAAHNNETRGLVSVYENTDAALEQFKVTGQPFLILRYKEGWKYPVVMKGDPRCFRWDMLLLGAHNEKYSENRLVKKSKQLENTVVLRSIETYADGGGIKIDKQFQGSREAYLAIMLENVCKLLGLMDSDSYKGKIIVDEYNEGMPMKWILGSAAEVKGLSAYFAKQNVVPAAKKPLLLLQFFDTKSVLGQEEQNFLNTYFTMLDAKNPAVKAFFDDAEGYLIDTTVASAGAKNVLESPADTFFRTVVDKNAEGLDVKKMAGVIVASIMTVFVAEMVKDMVKGTAAWKDAQAALENMFFNVTKATPLSPEAKAVYDALQCKGDRKTPNNLLKGVGLAAGGAVGLFVLYKLISETLKKNDVEDDEDAEEVVA